MSWSEKKSRERIDHLLSTVPVGSMRVEDFELNYRPRRELAEKLSGVRQTQPIADLSYEAVVVTHGAHVYANLIDYDRYLEDVGRETEGGSRILLEFLHLHYSGLDRLIDAHDAQRVDHHGGRVHAVVLEPVGAHNEAERIKIALSLAAAMLHAGRTFPLDDEQTMAVWFHDAIYDPRSATNEEDSAALAGDRLRTAGWPKERIERVQRIVLDTKRHQPSTAASAAVLDLDLMSLALPWPEFARNTEAIRREYSHVPDAAFAVGRQAFFATMLHRERLFFTPFGAALEAAARANLQRASQPG